MFTSFKVLALASPAMLAFLAAPAASTTAASCCDCSCCENCSCENGCDCDCCDSCCSCCDGEAVVVIESTMADCCCGDSCDCGDACGCGN